MYCVVLLCGLCQVTATFVGLKASQARLGNKTFKLSQLFLGGGFPKKIHFYERSFIFIEIVSAYLHFHSGFPQDVSA